MSQTFAHSLACIVGEGNVLENEPLSRHTTFEIGGPAALFVRPRTVAEVRAVVRLCAEAGVPWRVIGCGSDLLVSDAGVEGVVIEIRDNLSSITVEDGAIVAGAGATNAAVAEAACVAGLSGYEFASGIPGTVGGAAIMNAGAYDGEFSRVCESVTCVTPEGDVVIVPAADADWSYRHSMFDARGYIVVEARLSLAKADPAAIRARMDELAEKRAAKQPLDMPSAGSTFKRPEGHYAAALIDEAGLRGFAVGGAQVSTKHTGFVVNAHGATAHDVASLIDEVRKRVLDHSGIRLECEVRFWE